MRATVRHVYSSDIDVASYRSADPESDGKWIRFVVGPADSLGEESFDVLICTFKWLGEVALREGPQIGRHHLVLERFELGKGIEFIRHRMESLAGPDWPSLAEKLARIGRWEFEDYLE